MALDFSTLNLPPIDHHSWLGDLKSNHWQAFLTKGLPTRQDEAWKYTDISFLTRTVWEAPSSIDYTQFADLVNRAKRLQVDSILLVFINGYFAESLSDKNLLPTNTILCPMAEAISKHRDLLEPYFTDTSSTALNNLNLAHMSHGVYLHVPANTTVTAPIHIFNIQTGGNYLFSPRNLFIIGENSSATILDEYLGHQAECYFTNALSEIHTADGARLAYHKIQQEGQDAIHLSQLIAFQRQNSRVETHILSKGSRLAREEIDIKLQQPGAHCHTNGFYHASFDKQHLANLLAIHHLAKQTSSNMTYKGMLDKRSTGVFDGKIVVYQDAQKIQAQQTNHALLLSPHAEINAKPQFEIYADDVKCTHGNTVGQIDKEALFYLQSRGINKTDAIQLLTKAFAYEFIENIQEQAIADYMQYMLDQEASC